MSESSEENYRSVLQMLPVAAYTTDERGLITFFNDHAERLWGRAPGIRDQAEQFCGSWRLYLADGTPIPHSHCWMARALSDNVSYDSREIIVERPDGSRRTALAHAHPMHGPGGNVVGGLNLMVDISDRKRNEVALRESEELNRLLVDSALDAVVAINQKGLVTRWNPSAEAMFGWSLNEVVGRPISEFIVPPPMASADNVGLHSKLEHGASHRANRRLVMTACRRDGTHLPIELSVARLRRQEGFTFKAFIRDLTDHLRAEAAMRERRVLEEAVEAMRQVLGIVGHELRTPLAGLRAISELLLDPDVSNPVDVKRFLNSMNLEIIRMSDTVNNLLEAARLSSGVAQWKWAPFDAAEICSEAIETVRPLVDDLLVKLIFVADSSIPIMGDRHAVRRVVLNLLSNAQKHTPCGSITVRCSTLTEDGAKWVLISVTDTGEGVSPAIIPKLGQAFALNNGVVGEANVRGSGLGLSICRGIASAHGGAITLRSEVGHGSTFSVRLRADLPEPAKPKDSPIRTEAA